MPKVVNSKLTVKSAGEIKVDDAIWVYGQFRKVTKVKRTTEHPIQMIRIWVDGVSDANHICVPDGWQIKVETKICQTSLSNGGIGWQEIS